jgi:hypothetical protein
MRVGLSRGAKPATMNAPDLTVAPPRRWNVAVDGVVWLPRMIDKARAYEAGTLGSYLYGQSPVDDSLLARCGLTYGDFLALATAHADDAAVLAGIEARSPGARAGLRDWSDALGRKQRAFLALIDWDDGYMGSEPPALRIARRGLKPAVDAAMTLLKRLRPVTR